MIFFLGILGGLAGGIAGSAWSAAEAAKQRRWTRKMRQTAYQDTMADMAKAGLNPILAYQRGATSHGGGAMGKVADLGASMAAGSQAHSAKNLRKKQEDLVGAQQASEEARKDMLGEQGMLYRHQQAEASARAARKMASAQQIIANTTGQHSTNRKLAVEADAYEWFGKHGYSAAKLAPLLALPFGGKLLRGAYGRITKSPTAKKLWQQGTKKMLDKWNTYRPGPRWKPRIKRW